MSLVVHLELIVLLGLSSSLDRIFQTFHTIHSEQRKSDSSKSFVSHLHNLSHAQSSTDLRVDPDAFLGQTHQIAWNIIHTQPDKYGTYSCQITFDHMQFLMEQSSSDPTRLVVTNLDTHEKLTCPNTPFSQLQKGMLNQYIAEQHRLGHSSVSLAGFDLSTFILAGIDLSDVDFSGTSLSRKNFEEIVACNGKVMGAVIEPGENMQQVQLGNVKLDHIAANALIDAGADFKSVLKNYLANEPYVASRLYKADLLSKYLARERVQNRIPIDLSGFDFSDVALKGMNFAHALLSEDALPTIILGEGNLSRAQLAKVVPIQKEKTNFEQDCLAMLKLYSQTVAEIVLKSSTHDRAHDVAEQIYKQHQDVLEDYVWQSGHDITLNVAAVIKSSTGNCGEMAGLCKSMLDLYLIDSLKQLGYRDVSVSSFFAYTFMQASDHAVVVLACSFNGKTEKYIVDPWSHGGAWTYEEGMRFFREHPLERYVYPTITFFNYKSISKTLDNPAYQSIVNKLFVKTGVKEQLDATIRKNVGRFNSSSS